jgi:hypothetical protein
LEKLIKSVINMTTATVLLKSGEEVQVSIEKLEDYLYSNAVNIQTRRVQRRGKCRQQGTTL